MNNEQYNIALKIATEAHEGQTRWNGDPYITHPLRVADSFQEDMLCKTAAILHDVLEDTSVTEEDLLNAGISSEVIYVVKTVSRKNGESYLDFILRVKNSCQRAIQVKLADLQDNLYDSKPGSLQDKYNMAVWILEH